MRRFYSLIKNVHRESFDVDQTAKLEVNWWIVHRLLFGDEANQELVDALVDLYSSAYTVTKEKVREAAYRRAQAMLYSDHWVNEGKKDNSPLLVQEEEELFKSYSALKEAVQTGAVQNVVA